jgi:hypothetical protein
LRTELGPIPGNAVKKRGTEMEESLAWLDAA